MPTRFFITPLSTAATLLLTLAATPAAHAETIYKCTVNGQTAYQSSPCAGQGKTVNINSGLTEQQIQDAKNRAEADKAGLSYTPSPSAAYRPQTSPAASNKADCAALNTRRGELYGQRNGALRGTRNSNVVDRANEQIRQIEQHMAQTKCTPT